MATAAMQPPVDVKLMNGTASVLFVAFGVLLAAALGGWVLRHPVFSLGGISVLGDTAHTSPAQLRANVAPQLRGSFFTLDLAAARRAFEAVPWVRQAVVRREFPNRLKVVLEEHKAVALWGDEGRMVNSHGEVFEANAGDVEGDDLPTLQGPDEASAPQVLAMWQALGPLFEPLDLAVATLALTGRGSWQATLDTGAVLELGRGEPVEVQARAQRFARTLTQAASRYGRRPEAVVSADLRYADGYALRMRGVGTVDPATAAAKR